MLEPGGVFWNLLMSYIRQGLMAVGASLVTAGYFDGDQMSAIVGAAMVIISTAASAFVAWRKGRTHKKVVELKKAVDAGAPAATVKEKAKEVIATTKPIIKRNFNL